MLQSPVDDSRGILAVRPLGTNWSRPSQWNEDSTSLQGRICSFLLSLIYSDALSLYVDSLRCDCHFQIHSSKSLSASDRENGSETMVRRQGITSHQLEFLAPRQGLKRLRRDPPAWPRGSDTARRGRPGMVQDPGHSRGGAGFTADQASRDGRCRTLALASDASTTGELGAVLHKLCSPVFCLGAWLNLAKLYAFDLPGTAHGAYDCGFHTSPPSAI